MDSGRQSHVRQERSTKTVRRYRAFISYAHEDKEWGRWLHRSLEGYRPPRGLAADRLRPLFRDDDEGASHPDLGEAIRQALDRSDALVVVCSPSAASSKWVDEEVATFKRLGRSDRIFPVIVDGRPEDSAQGCFPPALLLRADADGVLTTERTEPWAVDVRTFGKRDTLLKVAASLLDVPYDALKRRDRARNARRAALAFAAAFLLLTLYLGTILIRQREVNRQLSLIFATEANSFSEASLSSTVTEDRGATSDRAMRIAVLGARTDWLHPAAPEAEPALARGAHASRALFVFDGHRDEITDARFDRDARRLVTASKDGAAIVWDLETGQEIIRLLGHEGNVESASFSPDGEQIVTSGSDGTVRIWDASTGLEMMRPGDTGSFDDAVFSKDGKRILAISGISGSIHLWDARSGEEITEILVEKWTEHASLSPDGSRILAITEDAPCLWRSETGTKIGCLVGHELSVETAVFSPDGALIVTANSDTTARVWRTSTGEELRRLDGHEDSVYSAAFSSDGQRVLTAGKDGTARLWRTADGAELARLESPDESLYDVAFTADGSQAVTLGAGSVARLWDIARGEPIAVLEGHPGGVSLVTVASDAARVVSGGVDGSVRVWQAGRLREMTRLEVRGGSPRTIEQDGSHVLLFYLGSAEEWQLAETWQQVRSQDYPGLVIGVAVTDQGLRVVTTIDNAAHLVDGESGEVIALLDGHELNVDCADVHPDGIRVATGSGDRTARIWDSASGAEIHRLEVGDWLWDIAFSPDGARLATGSSGGLAQVWETATGRELVRLEGHDANVNSIAFSPDGTLVVTTGEDGARIWRTETGVEVSRLVHRSPYEIENAAFSPDGTRVVTADGLGRTARVWDAVSGQEVARFKTAGQGILDNVISASFTSDGARVMTVTRRPLAGGWIQVWDVGWAMGVADRRLAGMPPLIEAVCDPETGKLRGGLRYLTGDDVAAMPILRAREGEDVCEVAAVRLE